MIDESRSDAPPRRVTLSPGETVADAARKAIASGLESLLRHHSAAESGKKRSRCINCASPRGDCAPRSSCSRVSSTQRSSKFSGATFRGLAVWPAAPANAT